jgi:hypothetical protein
MTQIDDEYEREKLRLLAEHNILKSQYPYPGISDTKKLLQWFDNTKFMSPSTQAQLAGVEYFALREIKISSGYLKPKTDKWSPPKTNKIVLAELPSNWRTKEWLDENLQYWSLYSLASAAKVSKQAIVNLLRRKKVKIGKIPYDNPCSSFKWCYYHYVKKRLSTRACATLAKISRPTFNKWLLKHKIPVRLCTDSHRGNIISKPWVIALAHKLKSYNIIESIIITDRCVTVRYKSPLDRFYPSIESYYFDKIEYGRSTRAKRIMTPEDSIITNVPQVRYQYGNVYDINFDNQYKSMVMISRKDLNNSTMIELRLALHSIMNHIIQRGWMNPEYPQEILLKDLEELRHFDLSKHYRDKKFVSKPTSQAILKHYKNIIFHYFDMSRLWRYIRRPIRFRKVLNKLFEGNEDITYTNIVKELTSVCGPKIIIPTFYAALFKNLRVKSVLDLSPGYGSKALACSLLNIKYVAKKSHALNKAIDNGFAEFIGLNYEWFDETTTDKYDLMIAMDAFSTNIDILNEYKKYANHIVAFVRKHNREYLEAKYKPNSIIPIVIQINGEIDYVFVW